MKNDIDQTLIRIIKAANGMRQADFSRTVNLSRSLVEKIEAGQMPITDATAISIRRAFSLDEQRLERVKEAIEILTVKR